MADCKLCISTEEISEIYDLFSNGEQLNIKQLTKILNGKLGVNKLAEVLNKFIDLTYNDVYNKIINLIKENDSVLYENLKAISENIDVVTNVNDKIKELENLASKIITEEKQFKTKVSSAVTNNIIRETVTVKNGKFSIQSLPSTINLFFLNNDFIVRSDDKIFILESPPKLLYGNLFYTGDLDHNGIMNVIYIKGEWEWLKV